MKNGHKYNKYIKQSDCKHQDLGRGNTFHTVQAMKTWVLQDVDHVSKLAPVLKKNTLAQTVASIHDFLYSHIKYKADGELQIIKSPGCAWATRKEGSDCKTVSLFASTILVFLGIPHAIRQVRQPGENSQLWTHVYVIVYVDPKNPNGNYYVLDGTLRDNKEVTYLEKSDEIMQDLPHVGLRGAAYNPAYVQRGLGNAAQQGFEEFLKLLSGVGVSATAIMAMRTQVQSLLSQGVDFPFQIQEKGVIVNTTFYPYITNKNPQGVTNAWDYVERSISKGLSNAQNTNTSTANGETIAQVANEVIKSGYFQRTFGAVFANGFDLSCFGSATNETKMTANIQVDLPDYLQRSGLTRSASLTNIRKLLYELRVYEFGCEVLTRSKYAKCTQKAGRLGLAATTAFIQHMIGAIDGTLAVQNKRLVKMPNMSVKGPHNIPTKSGRGGGSIRISETLSVLDFRIEAVPNTVPVNAPEPPVQNVPPVVVKPTSKPSGNGIIPTIINSVKPTSGVNTIKPSNNQNPNVQTAGLAPPPMTLGGTAKALLAVGTIVGVSKLYQMSKEQKN